MIDGRTATAPDTSAPAARDGGAVQRESAGGGERRRELALGLVPAHTPPLVQRTSLPEAFLMITQGNREDAPSLIVEDDVQTLTSGQMRKSEFMRELRVEAARSADEELRRVGRTSADCPYLDNMLAYYEGRSAEHLERAVRRYAPETRSARDARDYLPILGQRLGRGVARWVTTGQMPDDAPNEALAAMAGARGGVVGAVAGLAGLARKAEGGAGPGGVGIVDGGALVRGLGPGQPLDGGTRGRMERALGHSFAAVRVHADERSAALSHDLAARAFTIGPHVAFGAGELQPGTPHGDALLAHELAHVVQQGGASPAGAVPVGAASDPLERDADTAAEAAVRALHGSEEPERDVPPPEARPATGGLRLQRCPAHTPTPPVITRPPPAVDPMIARYAEALVVLRRLAPEMHALLSIPTLGGDPARVFTRTLTEGDVTRTFNFDLRVVLVDTLEGGTTEALFRSPPGSEVDTSTPGTFGFPLQMRVARRPEPTAEALAATLYHEAIHMQLFMDEWTVRPDDPTLSPFHASYEAYRTAARAAPDWSPLLTAWATALAGGGTPGAAENEAATAAIDSFIQEKYAFNAARSRMGASQERTNNEIVVAYIAHQDGLGDRRADIARMLLSVLDHIDSVRPTLPAFPGTAAP